MLLVWANKFAKNGDDLYITGSSSNDFFRYIKNYMRDITVLGWDVSDPMLDISQLEKFDDSIGVKVILNSAKLSYMKKSKIIKKAVRESDSISVKMPLPMSIIACHYALKYKKPFVIESGADGFTSLWHHGGSIKYKLLAVPVDLIVKYYHKKAKYIAYVSNFFLQNKYPSKAKQIGCSDAIVYNPGIEILEKRIDKTKNHKGAYVLGLVGASQIEYRGHDRLIKAAKVLIDQGYDLQIEFLGGGTADEKRIQLAKKLGIEKRIKFCGRRPHTDVLEWLDHIDVLVMPTSVEGIGRSIIEAMSRGCPVIGTLETGIKEQIASDCLVHVNDVDSLADTIKRIISSTEYSCICSYENYYRAFKYNGNFTNRIRIDFYNEFYKELLKA